MLALGWGFERIFAIIAIPAVITACAIFLKGIRGYNRQAQLPTGEIAKSI
jgi:AAHS family 4-hydroxybenzoate transporter-like MFS transporter